MVLFFILLSRIHIPDIDYKAHFLEQYIRNKSIVYKMGGIGPKYYDCGGVVTEAMRMIGYRGYKLNSHFWLMDPSCKQSPLQSKKGDILIDTNDGQGHVALITGREGNRIQVLDFVKTHTRASYRFYGVYPGLYSLKKECLLNQRHWIQK